MNRTRAAAAVALAGLLLGCGEEPRRAATAPAGATAIVERRTLVERETLEGTLGYSGRRTLANRLGTASRRSGAPLTLTAIAPEGSLVRRGEVLYRANGDPVVLMYGSLPAYRRLAKGVEDGEDVRQLEANLAALGLPPGVVDRSFTADTADAVARWQGALGLDRTGAVEVGRVAFAAGARRVGAHRAHKGDVLAAGTPVLELTSSRRAVSVELDVAKQALVKEGDRVSVTLPEGRVVRGRITSVGTVARKKAGGGEGEGAAGGEEDEGSGDLVVDVRVSIGSGAAGSRLDQAPVSVGIASETRRRALSVPVGALLARRGGGYAVEVVGRGRRRLLAVRPGLFAEGYVEVAGRGLREGMRVGVAE